MFPSEVHGEAEFDYTGFEDRFRGDEADIRARQAVYLQYFRGCQNVLDLGCGRGEFLEILGDNAISASGVESNLDMYLLCRDKRLNVAHQDVFAFLNSAPDESLGGVFCSQVIEHLSSANQLLLMELLGRKLKRGAPAVIETINPECLYALAHNFFLDPTHVRPVHPEMIRFALQQLDFERVELRFFAPVNSGRRLPQLKSSIVDPNLEQFNHAVQQLNELLYGYQDYAAIAWR
jgi:O-antigen chain-terminating methyltransferase